MENADFQLDFFPFLSFTLSDFCAVSLCFPSFCMCPLLFKGLQAGEQLLQCSIFEDVLKRFQNE